ncbi:MAG: hypothetical protein MZV70_70300 [Desulfobacterales bacterium]|nr:hypothetical protein [Desulfobacterales bacterium]
MTKTLLRRAQGFRRDVALRPPAVREPRLFGPRIGPPRPGRDVRVVRHLREEQKVNNGFPQTLWE